ncbi:AsnC family protein [Carnobacterium viridans]|uniref:HTH domain-containing protein n=1 Tax=Carnobacterium viridans TaxID=174587 RepID=A0A1H0XIH2_9LACT|nr:AsnC family protein [Carnobacterium viridans]SDQ02706.1 HTH domain-containing protein [Carnobacterium viridans]SDQ02715.1 HTH domain-containing protein [Carnobacterium viridans]SDQ02724.1 HTH domain-containing protein [Carnobacterium viridans]
MATISVKKLSEELGISKQAVHKRIEQLPDRFQPKKVDGIYELTAETADAIRKNKKASTTVNQPSVDAVDALKMQINELKEEKKRLYGQLDQFQLLLDQQQQLTLQSNQQIQQLQLSITSQSEENTSQKDSYVFNADTEKETEPTQAKKGFFSRLFNKEE